MSKLLGVLAGRDMPPELLRKWADSADLVWAADGGADRLLEAGIQPHRTMGDLDGISSEARASLPNVMEMASQEATDCDKLLQLAQDEGHNSVTLACVEGDRLDHVLATLSSCLHTGISTRLALRKGIGYLVRAGEHRTVHCTKGCRLSLIPLGVCIASISGVEWPLSRQLLTLGTDVSISNRAVHEHVKVLLRSGAGLLFVEMAEEDMPLW